MINTTIINSISNKFIPSFFALIVTNYFNFSTRFYNIISFVASFYSSILFSMFIFFINLFQLSFFYCIYNIVKLSTSSISIELLVITISVILFICLIYLYNIRYNIYINTLIYNNEIKIIVHLIIFIYLAIFNNIGIFLDNKNEILLNFLANMNNENNMFNGSNTPTITNGYTNNTDYSYNRNELPNGDTTNVYRLNGGELVSDYVCRGYFNRTQGTRNIDFQNYNETTARIVNGLSHNHESYTVIAEPNRPNSFSLVARNVLVNDNHNTMSVGEKIFNNLENQLLIEGSMHIPPRVNGRFVIELRDRSGSNTL